MYPVKANIHKVVIIRPGALGDVLAVRGTIRLIRELFPAAEISLTAPGERGRLFQRPGWADYVHDWERAAFSWLFSHGREPAPPALHAVFSGCDWILSYTKTVRHLENRLNDLAPAAAKVFCPSRPPEGKGMPIGDWLAQAAIGFCRTYGLLAREAHVDHFAARLGIAEFPGTLGGYAVIHPGSGSAAKNWPLDNFVQLARYILESGMAERVVVTSGEADGDLGERLASVLPGCEHVHCAKLEALAQILANAKLYIGNDSGVSHLAAAVRTESGDFPKTVAFFGPSDPSIWAPPGALVLDAGRGMDELSAVEACKAIRDAFA